MRGQNAGDTNHVVIGNGGSRLERFCVQDGYTQGEPRARMGHATSINITSIEFPDFSVTCCLMSVSPPET